LHTIKQLNKRMPHTLRQQKLPIIATK